MRKLASSYSIKLAPPLLVGEPFWGASEPLIPLISELADPEPLIHCALGLWKNTCESRATTAGQGGGAQTLTEYNKAYNDRGVREPAGSVVPSGFNTICWRANDSY